MRPPKLRRGLATVGVIGLTTATVLLSGTGTSHAYQAEILGLDAPNLIEDRYMVAFKDSDMSTAAVETTAEDLAAEYGGYVNFTYEYALRGYSATMEESEAKRLAADPDVDYVEAVGTAKITDDQTNPPSWGLDRVDQNDLPLDQKYSYPSSAGEGVTVYVLDTGVRMTHSTFGGRASSGYDFIDNDSNASDCQGHGTHVAGTVAGSQYGIAKKANVVSVRVLDCNGSGAWDVIVKGVDWVTQNAADNSVANMSLGGQGTQATLENAVRNSISSGVQYALAAGNNNANACNFTPARVSEAVTVGASTSSDSRDTSYSNYGNCLDLFAPGTSITSSSNSGDSTSKQMSGTSMASPHVAGAMALYLAENPSANPQQIRDAIVDNGVSGTLTNVGSGSPNILLNTEFIGDGTPVQNDFSVTADPGQATVDPGESASATVKTAVTKGQAQKVSLTASGLPSGATASFDPASLTAGGSSAMTISTATSTPNGTYTVTITGTGTDATRTASFKLTVGDGTGDNQRPEAVFTQNCYPFASACFFNGNGSIDRDGSIVKYSWDFGDGTTGTGAYPAHFYNGPGTYRVTLTVTDDKGATGSVTKTIQL